MFLKHTLKTLQKTKKRTFSKNFLSCSKKQPIYKYRSLIRKDKGDYVLSLYHQNFRFALQERNRYYQHFEKIKYNYVI